MFFTIHFLHLFFTLILPLAANIHVFLHFHAEKRRIQLFLGSRYSAGAYLILFVSKFGADSAKRELCRCFLRRVMEVTLEHYIFGPNVVYYFLINEYGRYNYNNNNNNNVLVPEGGRENPFPAIRPRHTQGRKKRRPST